MFSDRTLVRLCWVVGGVGIVGLFVVTQLIGPVNTSIKNINEASLGKTVSTYGKVDSFFTKDGHVFLTLTDEGAKIKVVVFENQAKKMPFAYNIRNGDIIKVVGKVDKYKGELEIIGERVEQI